jgi:hypothetical protein
VFAVAASGVRCVTLPKHSRGQASTLNRGTISFGCRAFNREVHSFTAF